VSVFEELTPPYSTIVADPPWHYDEQVGAWDERRSRYGLSKPMPYSTLSEDEIARLPVVDLAAPGAHLYLWTTNRYLWDARDICIGWGFDPVQVLAWCKTPKGLVPGGTFANTTEFVIYARRAVKAKREVVRAGALIREAREAAGLNRSDLHRAVRGGKPTGIVFRWEDDDCLPTSADWDRLCEVLPSLREVERPYVPPPPPKDRSRVDSTWWNWPRGPHSRKPAAFLDLVEQVSPPPYVELFARAPRLGWDSWGKGYEIGATA
jgi:N6-adenosine-specific RNA methylase IME4